MKPNPVHRLPAPLETAVQRVKLAAREAAERTIESLGLAALAAHNAFQRDGLLGAQFELNRKSAVFALSFNEAYDQRVLREIAPRPADDSRQDSAGHQTTSGAPLGGPNDWASLSLVADKEVEAQISADRFGMEIAHACEWELRELDAYVSTLLADAGGERDRNPLRPDLVGHAMIRAIDAVSEREDVRKVLAGELSRSLGTLLRLAYGDIVGGFRQSGVQPSGLTVRNRAVRRGNAGAAGTADAAEPADDAVDSGPMRPEERERSSRGGLMSGHGGSLRSSRGSAPGGLGSAGMGQLDPGLINLIRRLNHGGTVLETGGYGDEAPGPYGGDFDPASERPLPRNLIRAHREELRQASSGALDHMVIDVIGFMFDQILADPKVPPQLARQIARLQLPVLRAALGDKSFFSSRRHPVRRFINRIASLGAAFEDFDGEAAKGFLAKVRALVQEVAEGDFERIEVYEQKLIALEAHAQDMGTDTGSDTGQRDAALLLAEKEDQQRLRELYAQRLAGELKDVEAPAFLRDFIAAVWSQAMLRAAEQGGANGPLAIRLRTVARELFLSVQAKATPAHRKAFLAELPKLMQDLTEGMNLIAWPEAQRRAFFGQLMPAHAEALKSAAGRTLEINLMARQVDGALQRPPPSKAELASSPPRSAALPPPELTAAEAQRVGLISETAVNWAQAVDLDLSQLAMGSTGAAEQAAELADEQHAQRSSALLPGVAGLPQATDAAEAAEPTEGRALAEHVQVGYPYQMHIDEQWQKVRLSHVSPGRSFFIFTHGSKQRQTVSLTHRMLARLCETGRLKAYETSYLVERATARARRQLASLGAT